MYRNVTGFKHGVQKSKNPRTPRAKDDPTRRRITREEKRLCLRLGIEPPTKTRLKEYSDET